MNTKTVDRSADVRELSETLAHLLAQPFLFFDWTYPDQLAVHFGQAAPYRHHKLRHLKKGSYILYVCSSDWEVAAPVGPFIRGGNEERRRELPSFVAGTPVADCWVTSIDLDGGRAGLALSLVLADGSSIRVIPNGSSSTEPGDPAPSWEDDVPDWELFQPDGTYLRVGPGPEWARLSSERE